jgi:Fic-DOC domain mobile mystery protein B
MMMKFEIPVGATPIDPNEAAGLIPLHITTQEQLNEWEEANILEADMRLKRRKPKLEQLLTLTYLQQLHQLMFANTWQWAGKLRQSNKNIGVDWPIIATNIQQLVDDVTFQLNNDSYPIDETATRFHHRLVAIHLFSNGNGRHARLATDLLLLLHQQKRFSWGIKTYQNINDARTDYIHALRLADQHDYVELIKFVRS